MNYLNIRTASRQLATLCAIQALLCAPVMAQSALNDALEAFLSTQTQALPGKVSYSFTPLDPRTQLAACDAFEPFSPPGTRLWGKTTIGVRCLGPSSWTIYVQANIKVTGNYVVSARALPSGATLSATDLLTRSGDLSALPASLVTDPSQAIGKTTKNGLFSGQPLRTDLLISAWFVQQGQSVRTVASGPGFNVSSEGKALNNAMEGQVVQVRTPSGQVVSGVARAPGVVEVSH